MQPTSIRRVSTADPMASFAKEALGCGFAKGTILWAPPSNALPTPSATRTRATSAITPSTSWTPHSPEPYAVTKMKGSPTPTCPAAKATYSAYPTKIVSKE